MNLFNRFAHYLVGSYRQPLQDVSRMIFTPGPIVPDISFWQDDNATPQKVDFAKMKANGAKGVIIRAGQGSWDDPDFADYWKTAEGVMPRGIYWYYDSRYDPYEQVNRLQRLFDDKKLPEMEIWADYEENYGGRWAGWRHFANFMAALKNAFPSAKLGIYTGFYYWLDHSPNPLTEKASFDWFKQFPLWLAWYTTDANIVKVPKPWDKCLYWQYTSTGDGLAYGVESKGIDLSRFNGTEQEFQARYTVLPPPPAVTVTLESIVPAPSVKTTITVKANGTSAALTYVPPAPPEPPKNLYRIKDDLAAGIEPEGTRPYLRDGLPCTVRFRGVNSAFVLPDAWLDYIRRINPSERVFTYLFKPHSGWHNEGDPLNNPDDAFDVETLTFGGNIVEVTAIEGERAYIKCYYADQPPPSTVPIVDPQHLHPLVHLFSIQYKTYLDMTTNGRYAKIVVITPHTGDKPWINIRDLVKL